MKRCIASVGRGEDGLAMPHGPIERGMPLDEVAFYDAGMEFDAIYAERDRMPPLLRENGIRYVELRPKDPFWWSMFCRPVKSRKTGEVHKHGYGWCGGPCRWGTTEKLRAIDRAFFACLTRALACQSPSAAAIGEAREEGRRNGIEQEKRNASYLVRQADESAEKLRSYEKLFRECELWGAGSIEKGIDEFETFRKMRVSLKWMPRSLDTLMESAAEIRNGLMALESEES